MAGKGAGVIAAKESRREQELMSKETRESLIRMGFIQGVAYAAAEMVRSHDKPSYAYDLLVAAGIEPETLRECRVDEFDANVCREVIRSEQRK